MLGRGRAWGSLSIAILCVAVAFGSAARCGPRINEPRDCRQMGIGLRQQPPSHLNLPMQRSAWLGYLRDSFGYSWASDDHRRSFLSHAIEFTGATTGLPGSNLSRLIARHDLIGLAQGIASLAWACDVDASVIAGWLGEPAAGGQTGRHDRWLTAGDGFALLLAALRHKAVPDAADPADTVRGFYAALGHAVTSPTAIRIQQLGRWCCGDALVRLADNLTMLRGDNAFCLVSMQVMATTIEGHLATVRVIRTADQRVAGSVGRTTVEDQFNLRYTSNGWRIYK